jgi:mannose-6-phosphate isomerase-like protein (cupin superfamily)
MALAAGSPGMAQDGPTPSLVRHWSADELRAGTTKVLLTTNTHLIKLVEVGDPEYASHQGTTDIFFVEKGSGSIQAGGTLTGVAALPGMPGELRGTGISGAQSYDLKPGAVVNIPPSTPYVLQKGSDGLTVVQLRVNVGMHPWEIAATQQATLADTAAHQTAHIPLNSDQGGVLYWPADQLRHAHEELERIAKAGGSVADPRDLVAIPATRTHAYNFLHRVVGKDGSPPAVEFHEANTDVYFVVGGTATLATGGVIQNRKPSPSRPGEENGTLITGGNRFPMAPGDVVNMPPLTPHQSLPSPDGYTYFLVKVNTEHYPWELTGESVK